MVSRELQEKADQARRDGYMIFDLEGGPMPLGNLIQIVQDIFPNHTLDQLAITQADEDKFVVAAELGIETKTN